MSNHDHAYGSAQGCRACGNSAHPTRRGAESTRSPEEIAKSAYCTGACANLGSQASAARRMVDISFLPDIHTPHIHRFCNRCGYEWIELPLFLTEGK